MPAPDSVFLDLDETLIHTRVVGSQLEPGLTTPLRCGPYFAWLRPDVREILRIVGALGVPTYLCTASQYAYAVRLSAVFGLGIPERNILALEHLQAGRSGVAPKGVLIDDLDPGDEFALLKRRVLGIGTERYFQIPAFRGFPDPRGPQTLRALEAFLGRA
ncbi:MAG: hypothetical protein V4675_03555 [Verrucomicrobiota bacterium]